MKRIYLDYNATTPVHPEVAEVMEEFIKKEFGNPSSSHSFGSRPKEAVEKARRQVASLLGCLPEEIVFTSGGSESNNFAIRGIGEAYKNTGNHIITTVVEHPSVLRVCEFLEKRGYEITCVPVDSCGMVKVEEVDKAVKSSTVLISVMHANNEVGTIQPLAEISDIAKKNNISFHTDAAQSAGKIPVKVDELGVDLLTVAGHKIYAPKGIGALYIRRGTEIRPFVLGAGQENGLRAGTENVAAIAGLGKACRMLEKNMERNSAKIKRLRDILYNSLKNPGTGLKLNGHPRQRLPNTLNVSFSGTDSRRLLDRLPGIAASTGSACHSSTKKPSGVLNAMGLTEKEAFGAVRFSLGLETTEEEIRVVSEKVKKVLKR